MDVKRLDALRSQPVPGGLNRGIEPAETDRPAIQLAYQKTQRWLACACHRLTKRGNKPYPRLSENRPLNGCTDNSLGEFEVGNKIYPQRKTEANHLFCIDLRKHEL